MHIPDGFIGPGASAIAGIGAVGGFGVAVRQARRYMSDRLVPLAALSAAFVFAAQMINFPVLPGMSGHLIGGDAIGHVLSGDRKTIRPRQPERAPPVGLIAVLIRAPLNNGEIVLVSSQRGEPFGQIVVGSGLLNVRKPGFLGHAEPAAEKDDSFRGFGRGAVLPRSEALEPDGLERRQRYQRPRSAKKMAAIVSYLHGVNQSLTLT